MFDVEELDALALGAQMVESWGDRAIAKAAHQAIDKIIAVLPETLRNENRMRAMRIKDDQFHDEKGKRLLVYQKQMACSCPTQ